MPKSGIKIISDTPGSGPKLKMGDRVRLVYDIQLNQGDFLAKDQEILCDADRSTQPKDPRQLSLSDMFAIVTLAALVFAMAAPLLREMQPENTPRLLAAAGVQLAIVAGATLVATRKRRQLLAESGERIGVAYCGEAPWRHWPLIRSWLAMIALASVQLFLAMMLAAGFDNHPLSFLMFRLQIGCFAGFAFCRYLWRAYPNMLEFFENGISVGGLEFYPWSQVDVRDSRLFNDRIVVVLRPTPDSVDADTRVAQVSAVLRKAVFATSSAGSKPCSDRERNSRIGTGGRAIRGIRPSTGTGR